MNFTKQYGGNDWKEWHIQYDRVEEEWENLLAVFDWCAAHEQYNDMRTFWQAGGVLEFTNIYGCWDDRLTWLTWLIQAAERRGDWPTTVEAMGNKGFILIPMSQLEEADVLLRRAWNLHANEDPQERVALAQNIAVLRIYQEQYEDASTWLDEAGTLLDAAQLDKSEHIRRWINAQFYYGVIYFKKQDFNQAEMCLRAVLEGSESIGWQRAATYAQNFLADIAIAQGRFDEAEYSLQTGLTIIERNKDKRRTAFYKRSFARLQQKQGNVEEARRWAEAALDGFERLGMQLETKETHELLQELQV